MTVKRRFNLIQRFSAVALASLWILGFAGCGQTTHASEVTDISAEAVLELSRSEKPPLVLDVRTPKEYASGHVPGAINIPHAQVKDHLTELESYRDREVVVYCERGGRAAIALGILQAAGFERVEHMQGDMSGWKKSDLPVER